MIELICHGARRVSSPRGEITSWASRQAIAFLIPHLAPSAVFKRCIFLTIASWRAASCLSACFGFSPSLTFKYQFCNRMGFCISHKYPECAGRYKRYIRSEREIMKAPITSRLSTVQKSCRYRSRRSEDWENANAPAVRREAEWGPQGARGASRVRTSPDVSFWYSLTLLLWGVVNRLSILRTSPKQTSLPQSRRHQ